MFWFTFHFSYIAGMQDTFNNRVILTYILILDLDYIIIFTSLSLKNA